jgi:peroxiredoxin/peroxiredoxin (alkyl hydroperoxide reductase subunit C)
MSLVGKQFPNIAVKAMDHMGDTFELNVLEKAQKEGKKVLLFWYPKDFTFVCPTEIHAFQERIKEFEDRDTIVIGASCDTPEVHFAWLNTPKDDGGIEGVEYPILADTTRALSQELDILNEDFVTYRATYLIDTTGTVFYASVNEMSIGRNVDDFLRMIDAKVFNEEKGDVCPANWSGGQEGMIATRDGVASYLSKN